MGTIFIITMVVFIGQSEGNDSSRLFNSGLVKMRRGWSFQNDDAASSWMIKNFVDRSFFNRARVATITGNK